MVNPFDVPALFRALRNFSVTFAIIFASAILGVSVLKFLRWLLGELSLPWLLLWIIPAILISFSVRNESRWIPDETLRRRLALGIVAGAAALHVILAPVRSRMEPEPPPREAPVQRGPRSK